MNVVEMLVWKYWLGRRSIAGRGRRVLAGEPVVHLLAEVRRPRGVDLDEHQRQRREAIEDAALDELRHPHRHVVEPRRAGELRAAAVALRGRGERDVDRHRHAGAGRRGPERVVVAGDLLAAVRVLADQRRPGCRGARSARSSSATAVSTPTLGIIADAPQTVGRVRRVLGQPVVVRADAARRGSRGRTRARTPGSRSAGWDTGSRRRRRRGPAPRQPRRRVVAARPHLVPGDPRRTLLGRDPGTAVAPEVDRVEGALHHPRVALLEPLDARRAVAVLRGQPVEPEVGWLVDVRVGGDQTVRHAGHTRSITASNPFTAPPSRSGATPGWDWTDAPRR